MKGGGRECPDDGPANASRRSAGRRTASGFTIGGAVYGDAANPLLSGIEGVNVQVFGAGRKTVATTTTAGPSGIWRVDNLPPGAYTVVYDHRDAVPIVVNEENEAANPSIRMLRSSIAARPRD